MHRSGSHSQMEHSDIFAPYLFSFYAEYILQEMEMEYDSKIGGNQ